MEKENKELYEMVGRLYFNAVKGQEQFQTIKEAAEKLQSENTSLKHVNDAQERKINEFRNETKDNISDSVGEA
jgi:hypothetical protein